MQNFDTAATIKKNKVLIRVRLAGAAILWSLFLSCTRLPTADIAYIHSESNLIQPGNNFYFANLIDSTPAAWCESAAGDGIGETIALRFYRPVQLKSFFIKNGVSGTDFANRNRVHEMSLSVNPRESVKFSLEDSNAFQKITLKSPLEGIIFVFRIESVYKGQKHADTCISELSFSPVTMYEKQKVARLKKGLNFKQGGYSFNLESGGVAKGSGEGDLVCKFPLEKSWWHLNNEGRIFINAIVKPNPGCKKLNKNVRENLYRGFQTPLLPE